MIVFCVDIYVDVKLFEIDVWNGIKRRRIGGVVVFGYCFVGFVFFEVLFEMG